MLCLSCVIEIGSGKYLEWIENILHAQQVFDNSTSEQFWELQAMHLIGKYLRSIKEHGVPQNTTLAQF